jgi:hypothetical protein
MALIVIPDLIRDPSAFAEVVARRWAPDQVRGDGHGFGRS